MNFKSKRTVETQKHNCFLNPLGTKENPIGLEVTSPSQFLPVVKGPGVLQTGENQVLAAAPAGEIEIYLGSDHTIL